MGKTSKRSSSTVIDGGEIGDVAGLVLKKVQARLPAASPAVGNHCVLLAAGVLARLASAAGYTWDELQRLLFDVWEASQAPSRDIDMVWAEGTDDGAVQMHAAMGLARTLPKHTEAVVLFCETAGDHGAVRMVGLHGQNALKLSNFLSSTVGTPPDGQPWHEFGADN